MKRLTLQLALYCLLAIQPIAAGCGFFTLSCGNFGSCCGVVFFSANGTMTYLDASPSPGCGYGLCGGCWGNPSMGYYWYAEWDDCDFEEQSTGGFVCC